MSSALLNSKLVKAQASRLGFVACGLAKAEPVAESFAIRYRRWLDLDFCGEMDYMRRNVEMRLKPDLLVPGVRTIVSLAMNFMPSEHQPGISLYAQGKDYHDVLRERMQQLMQACGLEGRCFVDTAPVLERYWAWQSGVGIVTQSGLVAVPGYGPTVFLGELFLTQEADTYDEPLPDSLPEEVGWAKVCPALTPEGLDARLCISYQTIEHHGPLPDNLRLAAFVPLLSSPNRILRQSLPSNLPKLSCRWRPTIGKTSRRSSTEASSKAPPSSAQNTTVSSEILSVG